MKQKFTLIWNGWQVEIEKMSEIGTLQIDACFVSTDKVSKIILAYSVEAEVSFEGKE